MIAHFWQEFLSNIRHTTPIEYVAVFAGIVTVYFSRIENIWVYPTGIVNTAIYVYISFQGHLFAEGGLNIYYTIMSIIGWYMWAQKKDATHYVLTITKSNKKDWTIATGFFLGMWIILYLILKHLTTSTVPVSDSFASAAAYTGMLLMNKKKIEHWFWWIVTNIVSIPLYYVKGYAFTSIQFLILLIMAISGWMLWAKKMKQSSPDV
jgi:nicotinamide mononucleotide transporter